MAFARTEVRELEPMVKAGKKKFVRYQEGAELYSMGLHTFEELAKEAGAIYKIRRVVLVNLEIFEEYFLPNVPESLVMKTRLDEKNNEDYETLRVIEHSNLAYVEPHKLVIKNNLYLFFNEHDYFYVNDLRNKYPLSQLKDYIARH